MNNFIEFDLFEFLTSLTQDPWLLSFLIMLATFILEDAATTAASLLSVNGMLSTHMALTALIIGIILGDIGLYFLGHYGQKYRTVEKILQNFSKKGDVVYDPFMGTGTTALVAKRMKRKYIGSELLKDFCIFAEERLENIQLKLS